jgi:hypothetical protein
MHEGNCAACGYEKGCRIYLQREADERGTHLNSEERDLPPTLLALKVFNQKTEAA